MTKKEKALLTEADIKIFINRAIQKVLVSNKLLSTSQLSERLGLSIYQITKFRKKGMPAIKLKGYFKYEVPKVTKWLKENKLHNLIE
jgi:hypothetical protein